jgi:hypothetical protein
MNDYCLQSAGIPPKAGVVCGDDAGAISTKEKSLKFQEKLRNLGLRINRKKTIIGSILRLPRKQKNVKRYTWRGVFCEMLVKAEGKIVRGKGYVTIKARSELRLGEACGVAQLSSTGRPFDPDNLLHRKMAKNEIAPYGLLQKVGKQTGRRLAYGPGGPLAYGGGGLGPVTPQSFQALALFGAYAPRPKVRNSEERAQATYLKLARQQAPIVDCSTITERDDAFTKAEAGLLSKGGLRFVKDEDFTAAILAESRVTFLVTQPEAPKEGKNHNFAHHREMNRRRLRCAKKLSSSPLDALKSNAACLKYTSVARWKAANLVRRGNLLKASKALIRDSQQQVRLVPRGFLLPSNLPLWKAAEIPCPSANTGNKGYDP